MLKREIEAIKKIDNAIQNNDGKELEKIYKKYKACDTDYKGRIISIFLFHKGLNSAWKNEILHDLNDGKDKNENIYNAVSNLLGDENEDSRKTAWALLYIDNPKNVFKNFEKIRDKNLRQQTINLYINDCMKNPDSENVYYDILSHITNDEFKIVREQIIKNDYFLAQIMLNEKISYDTKYKLFSQSGGIDPYILIGYAERGDKEKIPDFVVDEIYLSCAETIFSNSGDTYTQSKSSATNIIMELPRQPDIDIDFVVRYKHESIKTLYMKDIYERICKKTKSDFAIDKILEEKDLFSLIALANNENIQKENFTQLLNDELEKRIDSMKSKWVINDIDRDSYNIIDSVIKRNLPISNKAKYDIINYSGSDNLAIGLLNDGRKLDINKFNSKTSKQTEFVHIIVYMIKEMEKLSFNEESKKDKYIKQCLLNMCECDYKIYKRENIHFISHNEAPVCEADDIYDKILKFVKKIKDNWMTDEIFKNMQSLIQQKIIDGFFSELENTIVTARQEAYVSNSFRSLFTIKEIGDKSVKTYENSKQSIEHQFQVEKLLNYKKGQFKEEIEKSLLKKPCFEWSNFENDFLLFLRNKITNDQNEKMFVDDVDKEIYYATILHDLYEKAIADIEDEYGKFVTNKEFEEAYKGIPKEDCR